MDVEATPANRSQEVQSTRTMIERVDERFGLKTRELIGDAAYGTAEFLGWMVNDKGIEPHVPVWDKGERSDGSFSRSGFIFDEQSDSYSCPNGKQKGKDISHRSGSFSLGRPAAKAIPLTAVATVIAHGVGGYRLPVSREILLSYTRCASE